jgi:hypothetical protein
VTRILKAGSKRYETEAVTEKKIPQKLVLTITGQHPNIGVYARVREAVPFYSEMTDRLSLASVYKRTWRPEG